MSNQDKTSPMMQPSTRPRDTLPNAAVDAMSGPGADQRVNPSFEEGFWRGQYTREPYYTQNLAFEDYEPAYRLGHEATQSYQGKRFEDVEPDLQSRYDRQRGDSRLTWAEAKAAVKAAWNRVERALPGDADHDGR